jgi:maltose alpha-D-glucosyltransferase/alpha-amylase
MSHHPYPRLAGLLALGLTLVASARAQAPEITGKDIIPDCPAWVNNAVVYQIYPQTFYDSNGDGIGDLQGIIDKLDYVKSLGVDAIWINPFFDSPFNDAGYDIRNYYKIAPRYGTNDDARRLFAEAHKRGLKVLFDYVISYTSIDNPWFVASCEQKPDRYSNWYIWTDNIWKSEWGDNWVHGYGHRDGNFLSNFFWSEPALNYGYGTPDPRKPWQLPTNHPDVLALRAEMQKVMRFWMDMGADGFRADMASSLVKGRDPNHATEGYWHEVRKILNKDYPQAFTVAEWSDPKAALDHAFNDCFIHWIDSFNDLYQKEGWRILNGMSDGHSFFDSQGKGDVTRFLHDYMGQYEATRAEGYITIPLGNHDIARINNHRSTDELEMIMAFGLTMPGVPFIYYGNEIGMRQLHGLPQIEGAYKPRAGARTPMQWTPGKNLGFSTADPSHLYLPVDPAADAPNVASEEGDPDSLLNRVRKLIALKHSEPALTAYAEFVPLYAKPFACPFIYARASGDHVVLVMFNPGPTPAVAQFPFSLPYRRMDRIAGKDVNLARSGPDLQVKMAPATYAIYRVVK